MRTYFFAVAAGILSSVFVPLPAQNVTVGAALDSTLLMIGDQANYSFEITQQPGDYVVAPEYQTTIPGGLEIVERFPNDTIKSPDGYLQIRKNYRVTAFEDSLLFIPPQPFVVGGDTIWSNSVSLKVVQPFDIDPESNEVADIKSIWKVPFDWKTPVEIGLLVILILIILLGAVVLIRKYLLKKSAVPPILQTVAPVVPPHLTALAELDRIKNEKRWQKGRVKEYYTELTDVIRKYIAARYRIGSMEMTSEEIMSAVGFLQFEQKSAFDCLKQILHIADLVKFAKWESNPSESELSLMNAYLFVNQTKKEEVKTLEQLKEEQQAPEKIAE
ncbi:MAG: hypothetical protein LBH80_01290 [Prevotellaceae bacterium]|nr:hypothetical protein [Prevotellaceae bacterium]